MFDVSEWNKKIYRNEDGSFIQGEEITPNEFWEKYQIRSGPKFNACWSHIPIRWTEDVRNMLSKIRKEFGEQVTFDQIKEKWCSLVIYYSAPDEIKDKVREIIKECKDNLISKGIHPPY